ncbi:hypothetical protein H312_00165, partial [Anncaliia algerae PRA339]
VDPDSNELVEMQIYEKDVLLVFLNGFFEKIFLLNSISVRLVKNAEFALKTNFKGCDLISAINYIFYYSVGMAASEFSIISDIPIHQIYKFLKYKCIAIYENDIRWHKRIGVPNETVELD